MTRAKSRLGRSLLLCFVAILVVGLSIAGVASAQTADDTLEPNDSISSATDLGTGGSYDDLEAGGDDWDYFAVQAGAGETISADIAYEYADGDRYLTLEDGNGDYLDGSWTYSGGEILAAIEAWRTASTIWGTDATVTDDELIDLVSTWQAEGS